MLFKEVHSPSTIINPYYLGRGAGVAYLNDPLVKLHKPAISADDPMLHSWEMGFLAALMPSLELVRDPLGQKYKFPDIKDECVLFSLAKYAQPLAKIMPPFMPVPYISDTIRP